MVSITWNRMQFMDWYQLHGIGCNWRTSSNSIISFTIELESKNTLTSNDFYLMIGTGIIDNHLGIIKNTFMEWDAIGL